MSDPDWSAAPPWARYWTQDRYGLCWWQHEPLVWSDMYVSRRAFDLDLLCSKWRRYNRTPGPRRMAQRPAEPRPEAVPLVARRRPPP